MAAPAQAAQSPSHPGRHGADQARWVGSATAPPLHRGAMPQRPWLGFWRSLRAGLMHGVSRRPAAPPAAAPEPWHAAAQRRRLFLPVATVLGTLLATSLFAQLGTGAGSAWLQTAHTLLFALLSGWVMTGFLTALLGFYVAVFGDASALSVQQVQGHALAPEVRTAVVMPICHEDVHTVFAGLKATCESLAATGLARQFDVFVLSDSACEAIQRAERLAFEALRAELAQAGQPVQLYLRLRRRRCDKKAGNVADFCRRWGRNYRYMVVLDADSVMSGECLLNMAKLMEVHPRAGIVQSPSQSMGHATLHARAQQFASRVSGRLFTLGMQYWQMGESHYWGHNAIIRLAPFMQHCGLAHLPGPSGLAGSILSHDFVEAALMRRAGYHVWLVADLVGSYEQQPPDLLAELQRDRRWCQGNLQNLRLIAEPGLHPVHRAMLATGAMAYLSAPLWLGFMALGAALWLGGAAQQAEAGVLPAQLGGLWLWTLSMLLLPRLMGLAAVFLKGEQARFGGSLNLLASATLETVVALLQAPVRMVAHSVFVVTALSGLKLDWKSPPRQVQGVRWREALSQLGAPSALAAVLALAAASMDARMLVWLLPVGLPLLLAVPVSVLSGQQRLGQALQARRWLLIPEESRLPQVLRQAWRHEQLARLAPALAPAQWQAA
jgi:membrane glycosyltransferase